MSGRVGCPHCGESIPRSARICSVCKSSTLYVVALTDVIVDKRLAYKIARSLDSLESVETGFLEIKARIDDAPCALLSGLSRLDADEITACLEAHGITSFSTKPAEQGPAHRARKSIPTPKLAAFGVVAVIAVAFIAGLLATRSSEPPAPVAQVLDPQQIAEIATRSTVRLRCGDGLGSGFFVTSDIVVTNAHVVCDDSPEIEIFLESGLTAIGKVIEKDDWFDFALVRVSGANAATIPVADASALARGDRVFFTGSPRGLDFTFSQGIVSHPARVIRGVAYVQVDAAVNPGNSGGPLLNENGEVVGLITSVVGEGSSLGLALPINYLIGTRNMESAVELQGLESDGWSKLANRALAENQRAIDDFRSQQGAISVLVFRLTDQGSLEAIIAQWNDRRPAPTTVDFRLVDGDKTLCFPSARISRWSRGASRSDLADLDPRFVLWLERNQLLQTLYFGMAPLKMVGCPDPLTSLRAELIPHRPTNTGL
jgi:V8-like Glu-specific endopeptidase